MSNVIILKDRELARQEAAWKKYVEAAAKAQDTRNFNDALVAGKAYGEFVRLFCAKGTI
ncbi:hypothetical protein [Sinorhizobium sp. RAC02]|uniref:hypothetical protein n=1 Tax=Sinorhizobium sp. RAC02 TaxID=1842534 RepID=UPI000855595E|nr:hypothetical protein [Sinorhizobium sp. RAC02]AOF88544.1 hypothetical protein BSY16_2295 [Sinorhizobium sp. RAC02]